VGKHVAVVRIQISLESMDSMDSANPNTTMDSGFVEPVTSTPRVADSFDFSRPTSGRDNGNASLQAINGK